MSQPEIDPKLAAWAFSRLLPYGSYPEGIVEEMNLSSAEHMSGPVALSHFYMWMGEEGKLRKFAFSKEDVIHGEFRGYELTEEELYLPVGIRMNVNLVPGSSPGITREEVVPLWVERTKSLRVPSFNYRRTGGSIWGRILENKMKIRF
jgi:hypothetical protein